MAIGTVIFYPNYVHYGQYSATAEPSVENQGYACSGGETTGPAYDIVDNKRTSVITVDTSGETDYFDFRFQLTNTVYDVNFMIVDAHNLGTTGGRICLTYTVADQACLSTAYYAGPLGSATSLMSTVDTNRGLITLDGIALGLFSADYDSNEFAAWFYYDNVNKSNFAGDVTIGECGFGCKFQPSIAPDINPVEYRNYNGIYVLKTVSGQNYSFKRYGERKAWQLSWSYISNTDKEGFQRVYTVTEGPRYPFWIDLGESATPQLYYVRFVENSLNIRKLTASAYEVSIMIESEV